MQPYFFPYSQQFRHIAQCDLWILFDTVKFTRKSWMSRNRIANRDTAWSYFSVPVTKGASIGPVSAATLSDEDWQSRILDKLRVYSGAPYYAETRELVDLCLNCEAGTLAELNAHCTRTMCRALAIETPIMRLSEMSLDLPPKADAGEWALIISEQMGAVIYSNAPGGRELFDGSKFQEKGIKLEFYQPRPLVYPTPGFEFTPDLSVIDSLMWLGSSKFLDFIHSK